MRKRICVILNAPPCAGKDTLADVLCDLKYTQDDLNFTKAEFKGALYSIASAVSGVRRSEVVRLCQHRVLKDTLQVPAFDGRTPREYLIFISETLIKPTMGAAYFGRAVVQSIRNIQPGTDVVFSDGGFPAEIPPLVEEFNGHVVVIRLHRPGYTFAGDSRTYLDKTCGTPHIFDVGLAAGEVDQAVEDILAVLTRYNERYNS
jgi:hypothetical protein